MDPVAIGVFQDKVNQVQFGTPDSSKGVNPNVELQNRAADEQIAEQKIEKNNEIRKETLKGNTINIVA